MSSDQLDGSQYEIPQSRGIPPPVRWFFAATVVLILFMGAISALESGHFHVWPVSEATRIDLGTLPNG
jgi:hypothetical protein